MLSNISLATIGNVFMLAVYLIFSFIFTLVCYRIYFHPLSKYPGPFLAKVTDWCSLYHAYRGDRYLNLYHAHQRYGPVVRIGPNMLSFNSSSALKTIYGHTSAARAFQKGEFYKAFPAVPGVYNTHTAISKVEHAHKRRVLAAAFSDAALKGVEPLVLSQIDTFVDLVKRSCSSINGLDMGSVLSWLTFDVMGELCFGRTFGMLTLPDQRFVTGLIESATHNHYICGHYLPLRTLGLGRVLFPSILKDRWRFIMHSQKCTNERMQLGQNAKKDFFYYLLDATDPETGEKFSFKELWGESNVLMIAGSDTTGTALAAILYYLCRNPAALASLRREIDNAFSDISEIVTGKTLGDCSYLKACIDEGLRLNPPVPGLLPRDVIADEGVIIDGECVPKGTVVGTPIYALHHDAAAFPEPFKFRPERWLVDDVSAERAREAFTPFSIGARGCIGKGLAYMEMRLTVAKLVKAFNMQLRDVEGMGDRWDEGWADREGELRLQDHFTCKKKGPVVAFEERKL